MILLIKDLFKAVRDQVRACAHLAKLQGQHLSCRFYPGVCIDDASSLGKHNVIFMDTTLIHSTIGDHTFVQKNSKLFHADIGKFCSIAAGVRIGLGSHPVSMVSSHPAFYSNSQPLAKTFCPTEAYAVSKRVAVGHDVWIGENAMIMDGVKIGHGAVIGAGAVVTKDVPAYAIVGGVPAKIIRSRFSGDVIKGLTDSRWWDRSDEWLQEHCGLFADPQKFLAALKEEHHGE